MLHPESRPAFPRPETARPTIKAADEGAVAHTIEPIKNMAIAEMKTYFIEK
jgi:hypothetical protein